MGTFVSGFVGAEELILSSVRTWIVL